MVPGRTVHAKTFSEGTIHALNYEGVKDIPGLCAGPVNGRVI